MLPSDIEHHPTNYVCRRGTQTLQLVKTIKFKQSPKRGVAVFLGRLDDQEVIVKWHQGRKTSKDEEEFCLWLASQGCPTVDVFPGWTLEGKHVLVMEKLQPLTDCDPIKVGLDILGQLKVIHRRCVHSGIKPDNIMFNPSINKYLLIDYGSISDQPLGDGYQRKSWSPHWSTQPRKVDKQVTYPEHDLFELCLTLKALARNKKERRLFTKMLDKAVRGYDRHRLRQWLRRRR